MSDESDKSMQLVLEESIEEISSDSSDSNNGYPTNKVKQYLGIILLSGYCNICSYPA